MMHWVPDNVHTLEFENVSQDWGKAWNFIKITTKSGKHQEFLILRQKSTNIFYQKALPHL